MTARIAGIAVAVPNYRWLNSDLPAVAMADESAKLTGIVERRHARLEQTVVDLAVEACSGLPAVDRAEIDAVIFVTQTHVLRLPGPSDELIQRLNLKPETFSISLSASCSGWVQGLLLAESLISGENYRKVLVVAGDTLSKVMNFADKRVGPVFGDAVSATLVEHDHGMSAPWKRIHATMPYGRDALYCDSHLEMDGAKVFEFAMREVPKAIEYLSGGTIDFYCLHQANRFILLQVARRAHIPHEFVPINIERWGNTSSASIPLLLCDPATSVRSKIQIESQRLMLIGFGAGFALAGAVMDVGPIPCGIVEL